MCLAVLVILTTLPFLVTALPSLSLTRDNVANKRQIVKYLVKYGHLDNKHDARNTILSRETQPITDEPTNIALHTDDEISNGIKSFQNSFGLEESGDLNEETVKLMANPRCGMSDITSDNQVNTNPFQMTISHHRKKRYLITHKLKSGKTTTIKWQKTKLTWKIVRYLTGSHLTFKKQDEILNKAFKHWEYTSDLLFINSSSNNADIKILFASGAHGDKSNFDGRDGVLAHAFPPISSSIGGDIHFDASERWNKEYDLFSVALHEIGHSLGLGHSNIFYSVMYASYRKVTKLYDDDRLGMDALYGGCKSKIDAAIYVFGDVYFLRKDMVWKVDELDGVNCFDEGFPKKIKDEFIPGIPTDVDAALVWSDYYMYVLKGDRSYGYNRFQKYIKYDGKIAYDWTGIPNNPDAALCYTYSEITWFFKDDNCWKVNDWNLSIFPGYPKKISQEWPGLPNNIDAAYYSAFRDKTFFFKDNNFWVFDGSNPKTPQNVTPGGPISNDWKGVCSEKY